MQKLLTIFLAAPLALAGCVEDTAEEAGATYDYDPSPSRAELTERYVDDMLPLVNQWGVESEKLSETIDDYQRGYASEGETLRRVDRIEWAYKRIETNMQNVQAPSHMQKNKEYLVTAAGYMASATDNLYKCINRDESSYCDRGSDQMEQANYYLQLAVDEFERNA